jgi:hypothetical protein
MTILNFCERCRDKLSWFDFDDDEESEYVGKDGEIIDEETNE